MGCSADEKNTHNLLEHPVGPALNGPEDSQVVPRDQSKLWKRNHLFKTSVKVKFFFIPAYKQSESL